MLHIGCFFYNLFDLFGVDGFSVFRGGLSRDVLKHPFKMGQTVKANVKADPGDRKVGLAQKLFCPGESEVVEILR